MLTQVDYTDLWVRVLGLPAPTIPCYYQYLQREVYFQDYLDLFGPPPGAITFPRTNVGGVPTVLIPGLPPDPFGHYTLIDPATGLVRLVVNDFPYSKALGKHRTIQYILIGEAAPSPSLSGKDEANSYFYNSKHINGTGYLSALAAAFGVHRTNKTNRLIGLADQGALLLDLFPFAYSYNTDFREGVNYHPFWNLLCNKICMLPNLHANGIKLAFAGPAALHHRVVLDLIAGTVAMPARPGLAITCRLDPNQVIDAATGIPFRSVIGNYISTWNMAGVHAANHEVNSDPRHLAKISKGHIKTPIYQCECWDSAYQVPNQLFIRIAFDLP